MSSVPDDFYGGSIYRDFRRSPVTIVNLHKNILKANSFKLSESNLRLVLTTSRELYAFVEQNGTQEIEDYRRVRIRERRVKGTAVPSFDLVVELLTIIIRYFHDHPKDALETTASLVVIEQFIEQKAGGIFARLWRKIISNQNADLRGHIAGLRRLQRRKREADYRDLR